MSDEQWETAKLEAKIAEAAQVEMAMRMLVEVNDHLLAALTELTETRCDLMNLKRLVQPTALMEADEYLPEPQLLPEPPLRKSA
jgi:hypothetical protein